MPPAVTNERGAQRTKAESRADTCHDHSQSNGSKDRRPPQCTGLATDIAELFHTLAKALFDPYRPELHYMRGPGPKWHAKHDRKHDRAPAELHAA